jgi:hypothetical protein
MQDGMDLRDGREAAHIDIEALRVEYLRHQAQVDQRRRVAERIAAHTPQLRQIDSSEAKPVRSSGGTTSLASSGT